MLPKPGGVSIRTTGDIPSDLWAIAKRFGTKVDEMPPGTTQHTYQDGSIIQAKKSLVPPYGTIVTVIAGSPVWMAYCATITYETRGIFAYSKNILLQDGIASPFLIKLGNGDVSKSLPPDDEDKANLYKFTVDSVRQYAPQKLFCFSLEENPTRSVSAPSSAYNRFLTLSPVHGSHNFLSVAQHAIDAGADPYVTAGTIGEYEIISGALVSKSAGESTLLTASANCSKILITPDGYRTLFSTPYAGSFFMKPSGDGDNDTMRRSVYSITAENLPHFVYALRDNKVFLTTPLQYEPEIPEDTIESYANRLEQVKNAASGNPHWAYQVPAPPSNIACGTHGVGFALFDLTLTEEEEAEIKAAPKSTTKILVQDRVASVDIPVDDMGVPHTGGTRRVSGYYPYLITTDYSDPVPAAYEKRFEVFNEATHWNNFLENFTSAIRQTKAELPPQQPEETPNGFLPPIYGDDVVITAITTHRDWAQFTNDEFVRPQPTDNVEVTPGTYWRNVSHVVTVVNTRTLETTHHVLSDVDLFLNTNHGWVPAGEDTSGLENIDPAPFGYLYNLEDPDVYPYGNYPFNHDKTTHDFYFFYHSAGAGIPATIVPISENGATSAQVGFFWGEDPQPPQPFEGHQNTADIKFVVLYPEQGGGIKTVEFDLGDNAPIRPIMFGGLFSDFFHVTSGVRMSAGTMRYDYVGSEKYDEVSTTMSGYYDTDSSGAPVNSLQDATRFSVDSRSPPIIGEADHPMYYSSGVLVRADFTSRRIVNRSCGGQPICVPIGEGRLAILVTPQTTFGPAHIDWRVVVCMEDTGEFVSQGDTIPKPDWLPTGYPLESSGWLRLTSPAPGMLVVSVDPPMAASIASGNPALGKTNTGGYPPRYFGLHRFNGAFHPSIFTENYINKLDNVYYASTKYVSYDDGQTWEHFLDNIQGDIHNLGSPLGGQR